MNTNELISWAKDKKVEERSIEGFWRTFESYRIECTKEFERYFGIFDKNKLEIKLKRISLDVGDWPRCNYNHVVSYLPIIYMGKELGKYNVLFKLSGETYDDYLVIY